MSRWIIGLNTLAQCAGPAGTDGGDAAQIDATAPGCNPTKEQKEQEACLNDDYAVFVALTGKNDAPGTKAAPVNSVARALELAKGTRQKIFVCEGTYDERVSMKSAVSVYGGVSCSAGAWKPSAARAVFGKLEEPGYALDVVGVAGAFEIVDLAFSAGPGTASAMHGIAARVVSSPGLSFRRVALTADG